MAKTLAAEMVPLPVTALPSLPKVPLPPMAMSLPGPVMEPPFRMTALPPLEVVASRPRRRPPEPSLRSESGCRLLCKAE